LATTFECPHVSPTKAPEARRTVSSSHVSRGFRYSSARMGAKARHREAAPSPSQGSCPGGRNKKRSLTCEAAPASQDDTAFWRPQKLPADRLHVTNDPKTWGKLLADVVDLFSETYKHGLGEPLTTQGIFKTLVTRKGALARRGSGYILVMAREALALRLRRISEEVQSCDVVAPSKI
jgi:hypothetical protein